MRPFRPALLALGFLPFLASGCAKSPDGVVVRSVNRIQSQLQIQGAINPDYYYAVAFDDLTGDGVGPQAIIGNTVIQNGVVGGSYRLMVLYHANTFQVFYRGTPSNEAERDVSSTSGLFVVTPTAGQVNGVSTINFTLNLDARLSDGTYIFPRGVDGVNIAASSLDINAITTNTILRDPNDNRIKPVDTFGAQQVASPVQVQINGTRPTVITDATGALNDRNIGVAPSFDSVDFSQIDITQLQLAITRSDNSDN